MDKVVEVQQAVKNNAGEVQDYLRDLDNWTKQMEVKDDQLRQAKKTAKSSGDTAKIREASPPKKAKTEEKKQENVSEGSKKAKTEEVKKVKTEERIQENDSKTEQKKLVKVWENKSKDLVAKSGAGKISSYDYSAWDKFDVDAACEEVEKEISKIGQGPNSSEDEEDVADERLRVEAVAEKDRGNAAFKAGNWDKAIEKYTRGMQLDPTNCVLPANRAMALLKKSQYGQAETDCTLALSIDPTYVKAFQRRASARTGLKKLGEAVTDYDEVLRLEASNKAARAERMKLVERIKESQKEVKKEAASGHKPPKEFEEKLKGALKKSDLETLKRDFSAMKEITTKMKDAEQKLKDKKVKTVVPGDENRLETIQKPTHLRSQKAMRRIPITDVSSEADIDAMDTGEKLVEDIKEEKTRVVEVKKVAEVETEEITKSKGFCKKMEKEISADLSKVELVDSLPCVPSSSSRFLADWRQLKTQVNRSKYLRQFRESDYLAIFKSSVDGAILGELVGVVQHLVSRGDNPEIVITQVRGMAKLPRLTAVAMFMSDQEKQQLRGVVTELQCLARPGETDQWTKVFSL